jgi:tRNA 2-selenouridine synthase
MAGHRGSLFGGLPGRPQPNQKGFESALLVAMEALDPARPIVVEAESSRIGDLMVPPALWARMSAAQRIEISADRDERARYLVRAYSDITARHDLIEAMLERLPVHPSQKRLEGWRGWLASGDYAALAAALMELHYDPAYRRGRRKDGRTPMAEIALERLDGESFAQAADRITQLVEPKP